MHIIIQHTFCAIGYVLPFDTYEYALYTTPPYQPHCKNANFCLLLCLKYTQTLIKTELVSKEAELNILDIQESYVIFGHFHNIKVCASSFQSELSGIFSWCISALCLSCISMTIIPNCSQNHRTKMR